MSPAEPPAALQAPRPSSQAPPRPAPEASRPSPEATPDLRSGATGLALRRAGIRTLLLVVIAALLLLSLAGQIAKHRYGLPTMGGLVTFFYVDEENNLPSWYQSVTYLFAAVLLALIALPRRRQGAAFARHWAALAGIFVFLSLDEMGSLHERTTEPLQRLIEVPGPVWNSTWVVLGLLAVAAVGLAYLRFFLHLSGRERTQVALAAGLLVGGAIGMEMANAAVNLGDLEVRKQTFRYAVMVHVEEALEMLGLAVFIDFLLGRLARDAPVRVVVVN